MVPEFINTMIHEITHLYQMSKYENDNMSTYSVYEKYGYDQYLKTQREIMAQYVAKSIIHNKMITKLEYDRFQPTKNI